MSANEQPEMEVEVTNLGEGFAFSCWRYLVRLIYRKLGEEEIACTKGWSCPDCRKEWYNYGGSLK